MGHGPWHMNHGPRTINHVPLTIGHGPLSMDGPWCTGHGPWCMQHGPWTMDHAPWSMVHRPWTMVHGAWAMDREPWSRSTEADTADPPNQMDPAETVSTNAAPTYLVLALGAGNTAVSHKLLQTRDMISIASNFWQCGSRFYPMRESPRTC